MAASLARLVVGVLVMGSVGVRDQNEEDAHTSVSALIMKIHSAAKSNDPNVKKADYPRRFAVSDAQVPWHVVFDGYEPTPFTHQAVTNNQDPNGRKWADPLSVVDDDAGTQAKEWSDDLHRTYYQCGEDLSKTSKVGPSTQCWGQAIEREKEGNKWNIPHEKNMPLNPMGRTGMTGRGLLGKFGANHAADPLVTRVNAEGQLEIALIKRKDSTDPNEMAIPGGMVNAGDDVSGTLKAEFAEEAVCGKAPEGLVSGSPEYDAWMENDCPQKKVIDAIFSTGGVHIYAGYVDDPRNTDNAWMETAAVHFHGHDGAFDKVELHPGDDAAGAQWKPVVEAISGVFPVYASHKDMIEEMFKVHCEKALPGCPPANEVKNGKAKRWGIGAIRAWAARKAKEWGRKK